MKSLWSDRKVRALDGLELLVYTSQIIGADPNLVLWGGGNSSVKLRAKDHTGKSGRVLWIKGSGSNMKTITRKQFTPLRLDELSLLEKKDRLTDEEMVDYQGRCVLEPGAPKPSIETLLHAFLPSLNVYHTHADAICALTDTPNPMRHLRAVYGNEVALVPYVRPGFTLSKLTAEAYWRNPNVRAIILDKHGLITWGETAKEAYLETIQMVSEAEGYIRGRKRKAKKGKKSTGTEVSRQERRSMVAEIAPVLRGGISKGLKMVLLFDDDPRVLRFINQSKAGELTQVGPFTPDHLMHTKPWPLYLNLKDVNARSIRSTFPKAIEKYRKRYKQYFERYKTRGVRMLDPNPRVILIPGVGMFTTGKDSRAARITKDLYRHTMDVIEQSSAIERYLTISPKEICDFEYWPMENFKLTLLSPEKELSRRIALVTGASGGIGQGIAYRLAAEGASVILTDIKLNGIEEVAETINRKAGNRQAIALRMDVSRESSVREAFSEALRAFGGLDILISNAGVARSSPVERMAISDWEESLAVNATGHFLVCRETLRIFSRQGIGGNITVIATKNVLAPGKDFGAYSASKAAQLQLSRIMAIEGADQGIRVNMVNPDGVFESSGLWTQRIRKERAKAYGIAVEKLEAFYAGRNLLKSKILPEDVAEAVLFLVSDRSAKTTGSILPVDGGLREAFPR